MNSLGTYLRKYLGNCPVCFAVLGAQWETMDIRLTKMGVLRKGSSISWVEKLLREIKTQMASCQMGACEVAGRYMCSILQ